MLLYLLASGEGAGCLSPLGMRGMKIAAMGPCATFPHNVVLLPPCQGAQTNVKTNAMGVPSLTHTVHYMSHRSRHSGFYLHFAGPISSQLTRAIVRQRKIKKHVGGFPCLKACLAVCSIHFKQQRAGMCGVLISFAKTAPKSTIQPFASVIRN